MKIGYKLATPNCTVLALMIVLCYSSDLPVSVVLLRSNK